MSYRVLFPIEKTLIAAGAWVISVAMATATPPAPVLSLRPVGPVQTGSMVTSVPPAIASPPEPMPPVASPPVVAPRVASSEEVRMIEKLVEQWNAARSSLESSRQAAEMADLRQAERLDVHVNRMEERLAAQRKENEDILRVIQNSNSENLRYAGLFVGLGLFSVFMLSLLQWRATLKLTQMVLRPFPQTPAQLPPISSAEGSEPPVATNKETIRLIESLDRMEQRIRELETAAALGKSRPRSISRVVEAETRSEPTARATDAATSPSTASIVSSTKVEASHDGPSFFQDDTPKTSKSVVVGILGKGEALLQLGQPGEALIAFEETLRLDPYLVEAWVKKGSALERLERMEDALACYDRAIELDKSFTLAYLYKGGVCNRLERFDEALACYEQALRSHETATTI